MVVRKAGEVLQGRCRQELSPQLSFIRASRAAWLG